MSTETPRSRRRQARRRRAPRKPAPMRAPASAPRSRPAACNSTIAATRSGSGRSRTGAFGREVSTERLQEARESRPVARRGCAHPVRPGQAESAGRGQGLQPLRQRQARQDAGAAAEEGSRKLERLAQAEKAGRDQQAATRTTSRAAATAPGAPLTRARSAAWRRFPSDRTCAARAPAPRLGALPRLTKRLSRRRQKFAAQRCAVR